jgi:phospholipase/carboxylesterase
MANPHLLAPPTTWGATADSADVAVIAVHGRGQDPAFMRGIADRIDAPNATWFAPHAADSTWYPNSFLAAIESNQPDLDEGLDALDSYVAVIEQLGFSVDRIVLLGFSQGACLVSQYALTRPRDYRAVVVLTGGFIGPVGTTPTSPGRLDGVPAFFGTMADDGWVPLSRVDETAALFTSLGARVQLTVTPGDEHAVAETSITAARSLILGAST